MNLVKETNCFHSRQLTINNYLRYNDHISSCMTCMTKVRDILDSSKILESHFNVHRIGESLRNELRNELLVINKKINPGLVERIKIKSQKSYDIFSDNSVIFIKDLLSLKKLLLISLVVVMILVLR